MTINRKQAPSLHSIELGVLPRFHSEQLSNGIQFHVLDILQEDMIQVELVLSIGKIDESKKMQLQVLAAQIKEGTSSKTANDIADAFEFYGASIKSYNSSDSFHLQLTCLTKFLEILLPLFLEIFREPTFPEKELSEYVNRQAQKLLISEQKVDFLSNRLIFEAFYGKDHFYGYGDKLAYLNDLSRKDLIDFHQSNFNSKPLSVFVNGKVEKRHSEIIRSNLETFSNREREKERISSVTKNEPVRKYLRKENALQSAIRVGRIGVPKYHSPDYPAFLLTNLILGGFFGSRLMSNIREDKGYTYGIYSYPGMFKLDTYWMISTETGKEVASDALKEIYKEINRIQNDLVSEDELSLAKSYFSGNLLNRLSGSFKVMRAFMELQKHNLNVEYYNDLEQQVKLVTAKNIRDIANKWMNRSDLNEIVVGS